MMVNGKFAHCDYVNRLSVNLFCIYVVLKYTIIIYSPAYGRLKSYSLKAAHQKDITMKAFL